MSDIRKKSISTLGLISMLIGIAALAAGFRSVQVPYVMLGGFGVMLGLAGLLRAGNGSVIPSLGVLLSLGVVAVPLYQNHWWQQHVRRALPGGDEPRVQAPATQSADAAQSAIAGLHVPALDGLTGSVGGSIPFPAKAPAFIRRHAQTPPQRVEDAEAALQDAREELATAEAALQRSLENDAGYRTALRDANFAEGKVRNARTVAKPGSIELTARSRDWIAAESRRKTLLETALNTDPDVTSARQSVAEAQAELKAARAEAVAVAQTAKVSN